jgi:hypothetical protein
MRTPIGAAAEQGERKQARLRARLQSQWVTRRRQSCRWSGPLARHLSLSHPPTRAQQPPTHHHRVHASQMAVQTQQIRCASPHLRCFGRWAGAGPPVGGCVCATHSMRLQRRQKGLDIVAHAGFPGLVDGGATFADHRQTARRPAPPAADVAARPHSAHVPARQHRHRMVAVVSSLRSPTPLAHAVRHDASAQSMQTGLPSQQHIAGAGAANVATTAPQRACGGGDGSLGLLTCRWARCSPRCASSSAASPSRHPPPAAPFPPSIFLDKNRRDIGKSQSIWTDSKMESAGSRWRPRAAPSSTSPSIRSRTAPRTHSPPPAPPPSTSTATDNLGLQKQHAQTPLQQSSWARARHIIAGVMS